MATREEARYQMKAEKSFMVGKKRSRKKCLERFTRMEFNECVLGIASSR